MDIFFNNDHRIRVDGRVFYAGQKVRYRDKTATVIKGNRYYYRSEHESLLCFYSETGKIPIKIEDDYYNEQPHKLEIITPYLESKKNNVIHMKIPRIFKWALLTILVLSLWRLSGPLVELLLQFIQKSLSV